MKIGKEYKICRVCHKPIFRNGKAVQFENCRTPFYAHFHCMNNISNKKLRKVYKEHKQSYDY